MPRNPDILQFIQTLFLKPKTFFQEYFPGYERPPYFLLVMSIFSLGYGLDRVTKTAKSGNYLDNWISYWFFAILVGGIGGLIWYMIGGWFYHKRLQWSKGTRDIVISRNLFLFSSVVSSIAVILVSIVLFAVKESPSDAISVYITMVLLIFLMIFHIYSVLVSYSGVTAITDVEQSRARIWFLVLPLAIYSLLYIYLIWQFFA